jgi:hypothetical protein
MHCHHKPCLRFRLCGKSKIGLDGAEPREQLLGLLVADGHGDNDIVLGLNKSASFIMGRGDEPAS